ncbi:MAG: potassium channel family protein [Chitinivibrionales bacterium]
MDSFIVGFWKSIFSAAFRMTPFGLLSCRWNFTHRMVDAWVLGHFFLAILAWVLLPITGYDLLRKTVGCYAIWRIAEIVIYQVNTILFDPFKSSAYALRSYRRSVLLAMQNFAEVFFWFAAIYKIFANHFDKADILKSLVGSIYFSAVTMATLGYGDITPLRNSTFGRMVVVCHVCVGFFLSVIVIARFISLLPRPGTMAPDENEVSQN